MKTLVFTGGHHTSALVVAKELILQGKYEVVWFGHRYSMWGDKSDSAEYKEVTAAGIKFYDLKAGKFYNTFNLLKLIRIPWGFIQAFYYLLKVRPAGIVSFGGYLAVPTVISGWLLGIPSITHEQTITTGWANKLISLFVKKIAITWPQSAKFYPQSKTVLSGLPLRPEIIEIKKLKVKIKNYKPVIYITGGKQGSHIINQVIFSLLPQLVKKYTVIHQTGSFNLYKDHLTASHFKYPNYIHFEFDSQKAIKALNMANLVVSRAGAHTVYELAVLGIKSILIPIPWVSHNEQTQNAQILVQNNLAILLPESQLTLDSLSSAIHQGLVLNSKSIDLPLDGAQQLIGLIIQSF